MIGNVGSDPFGALLLESLHSAGVAVAGVESVGGSSGAASILVLPDGENSIVISGGANARLTGEDVARRIRRLTARIVMCQLEVPMEATESALIEARTSGAVTILDPAPAKPLPSAVLSRVDYLTPNQVEAATLLGVARRIETVEDAMDAALKLLTLGPACVIVKIGRLGCVVATSAGTEWISGFEVPQSIRRPQATSSMVHSLPHSPRTAPSGKQRGLPMRLLRFPSHARVHRARFPHRRKSRDFSKTARWPQQVRT